MPAVIAPAQLRQIMRDRAVEVGHHIRDERLARGIGPTDFAGFLGVPLQTLHKIETGEIVPRDHLKAAIALALEVELADLYPWPTRRELIRTAKAAA